MTCCNLSIAIGRIWIIFWLCLLGLKKKKKYLLVFFFQNVSIGLVGEGMKFKTLDERETGHYLSLIEGEERRGGGGPDDAPAPQGPGAPAEAATAMDTTD